MAKTNNQRNSKLVRKEKALVRSFDRTFETILARLTQNQIVAINEIKKKAGGVPLWELRPSEFDRVTKDKKNRELFRTLAQVCADLKGVRTAMAV